MGSENETYEVEFTEECIEEIRNIYEYISNKLFAKDSAKRLIRVTKEHILSLEKLFTRNLERLSCRKLAYENTTK